MIRWHTALIFLLAGLLSSYAAAAKELFVMTSTVDGLEEGAMIDGAEPLDVPAGATVTLVSDSGRVITLEGPFSGPPAPEKSGPAETGLFDALGQLFEGDAGGGQAGVYRALGDGAGRQPTDPWVIDVSRWGRYCVASGRTPVLWRPSVDQDGVVRIKNGRTGARASARWKRGEATTAWPADMPAEDGVTYLVRLQGNLTARKITIHMVPADIDRPAAQVVWMARRGCMSQAKRLLARLR